ncbi:unnamed protein product [Camellia sinensis]
MADIAATSWFPSKNDKPVIVRVKRKAYQSHLEAFCEKINERSLKRPFLDSQKLSISDSSGKGVKALKTKKVFLQHVETVSSLKVSSDVLQSFMPKSVDEFRSKETTEERRHTFKTENKQDQLLVKAKQKQEALSKNARFEQIWRSRKGRKEATHDDALHEICHVYDVVRVDVEETASEVQEQIRIWRITRLSSYLPLLRKFIPSAAAEIEYIHDYMSNQDHQRMTLYDLYAVKDDTNITEEDASNPFPVQVEDDGEFCDGLDESDSVIQSQIRPARRIFGGVGIACLPLGLIFSFFRRPKAVITRSQFIKELLLLEEDVKALEEMYPQGEKAETAWAMTVLGYLAKLVLGVLGEKEQSALRAQSNPVRSSKSQAKITEESVPKTVKFQPFIQEEALVSIHNDVFPIN